MTALAEKRWQLHSSDSTAYIICVVCIEKCKLDTLHYLLYIVYAAYIVYIAYDCSCWKTMAVTQFWQYCIYYMRCMYWEVQTRYITLLIVYCVCSIYCVYSVWLLVLKNCGSCTVLTVLHILCDVWHGDALLEALRENSAEEERAHVRNHRCQRCSRAWRRKAQSFCVRMLKTLELFTIAHRKLRFCEGAEKM